MEGTESLSATEGALSQAPEANPNLSMAHLGSRHTMCTAQSLREDRNFSTNIKRSHRSVGGGLYSINH